MQILYDRIRKDGIVRAGNVLKVDRFLNHQMDIHLFQEIGKEFKRRFEGEEINKILTIEASGIGIACIVAEYFDVPVVFAKKTKTKNIAGEVYTTKVESFTHGTVYDIIVSKEFLGKGDKVLVIDDFLAKGKALDGLTTLIQDSGAELVGAGIVNKKALFFDIDGTLFSEKLRQVPQSAVLALKKTMEKGNLTFINTGRTWCQTSKIREEAPVNGLLCGCGTYISVDGKTLYDQRISPERAEKLKEDILRFRMDTVMEGVDACFFRPDGVQTETMRAIRSILDQSGSVSAKNWSDPSFSISKFCVAVGADSDPAGFFETLRDFEVIDRGGGFYECVPMGHSKASAIEWILKQYGIALEDAWVFGDSMNDLSMFQYVPNTVVMGKHDAGLEPYATFTAKTVEEDGIYRAMEELGLL